MNESGDTACTDLRRRAETRLADGNEDDIARLGSADLRRLIHDLRVHQIELEIQNEELRLTQARLEKSRSDYQDLFHQAPAGYVSIDAAGLVLQANRTFLEMVGRAEADITGQPFAAFIDPRDKSVFLSRLRAFFKDPRGKLMILRLVPSAKGERIVQLQGRIAAPTANGEKGAAGMPRLLLTVSDVTEQRQTEATVARAKAEWEKTFDAVQEMVAIIDADQRIVRANHALANRVGRPLSECIGRHCYELFHRTAQPPVHCPHCRVLLDGQPRKVEFEEEMLGGHFMISVAPLGPGPDGRMQCVHVAHDITDLKRAEKERLTLERQVQQAQKMQSLTTMAGAIAHRFNNLLAAVIGRLDLMRSDLGPGHPLLHDLAETEAAAHQAADISRMMLTYIGQTWSQRSSIEVARLVCNMLPLIRQSLPPQVSLDEHLNLPETLVSADPSQLRQAIMNLMLNASEAIGQRPGRIRLTVTAGAGAGDPDRRYLPPDELVAARCVFIAVKDDGPGMDEATRARIFDPFFSTKFIGRGLGMSVTQGIVKAHGGFIDIHTVPDRGTTVTLALPVLETARA